MSKPYYIHLVTVGISIISNYCRNFAEEDELKILKDDWEVCKRSTPSSRLFMNVYERVKAEPRSMSAELNAMWNYIQEKMVNEVYLYSTDTGRGEFCANQLQKYFYDEIGVRANIVKIGGFGVPSQFEEGLVNLLDKISNKITTLKQNPNNQIYLNATGGFKPENAILYTSAALLKIDNIYYLHEELKKTVQLPLIPITLNPKYMKILKYMNNYEREHGFTPKSQFAQKYGEENLHHLKTWNLIIEENGRIKLRKWTKTILKYIA